MAKQFLSVAILFAYASAAIGTHQPIVPSAIANNYQVGVEHYRRIIDLLIAGIGDWDPAEWTNEVKERINLMHLSFETSLEVSEKTKKALDQETNSLAAQTGRIDREIEQITDEVLRLESTVASRQREITIVEERVRQAEASVETHQTAVNEYESKLQKAKTKCFGRRKRWAISFRKPINWLTNTVDAAQEYATETASKVEQEYPAVRDKVIAGLCETISILTGDIQRARGNLKSAENNRDNEKSSRDRQNEHLNRARHELASQQLRLTTKKAELASTDQRLKNVRYQLTFVGRINQALKTVIVHIDQIAAGSGLAKEFVADLDVLPLETLISPLNQVADELISHIPNANAIKLPVLSKEQKIIIARNIELLQLLCSGKNIFTSSAFRSMLSTGNITFVLFICLCFHVLNHKS